MSQAILDALVDQEGAVVLSTENWVRDLETDDHRVTAVFFTGDPEKKPETADVAVAVRELARQNTEDLRLALVNRADEAELMKAHGVTTLPSVAFFSGGRHIETIARIQNWSVYAEKWPQILAKAKTPSAG